MQSLITFLKLIKLNLNLSPVEGVLAILRTDISDLCILKLVHRNAVQEQSLWLY